MLAYPSRHTVTPDYGLHNDWFTPVGFFVVPTLSFRILRVFLVQAHERRRVAVATHFTVSDDAILGFNDGAYLVALKSVNQHVDAAWDLNGVIPNNEYEDDVFHITWSTDLMVIRIFPDTIRVERGVVSDYTFQSYPGAFYPDRDPPKYDDGDPSTLYGNAYAQIDTTEAIVSTEEGGDDDGNPTCRKDGY